MKPYSKFIKLKVHAYNAKNEPSTFSNEQVLIDRFVGDNVGIFKRISNILSYRTFCIKMPTK